MAAQTPVPQYHLYEEQGDSAGEADFDLLHIETIPKRSGVRDWTIRPHFHPRHVQLLLIATGGGRFTAEGEALTLDPPCLVAVPAMTAHDFAFLPGTDGWVTTAAEHFLGEVAGEDPRLVEATRTAGVFPLDGAGAETAACFAQLHREFMFSAPGRRSALRAHFLAALVALLRARSRPEARPGPMEDRDRQLALRFRRLIEQNFREEKRLAFYAARLAVTPGRLNAACRARLGTSAAGALHDRLMTEARRCLAYTDWPVAEVGYALGFQDPAYFNRFFARRAGVSPGAWRARAAALAFADPVREPSAGDPPIPDSSANT